MMVAFPMEAPMPGRDDEILAKLDILLGIQQRQEAHLDGMDKRLDGMDKRLDGIDRRLDGIDKRIDGIDVRLQTVERDVRDTKDRLTAVEASQLRTEGQLSVMLHWLQSMDQRFSALMAPVVPPTPKKPAA